MLLAGPAAAETFATCQARFEADPEAFESACFARVARVEGQRQPVIDQLERNRERAPENLWLPFNRALIELDLDRHEAARRRFGELALAFEAAGNVCGVYFSRDNLQRSFVEGERWAEAERELAAMLAAAGECGDGRYLPEATLQRAFFLVSRGERLAEARVLLETVGRDYAELGADRRLELLELRARLAFQLGRFAEAETIYGRRAALGREQGWAWPDADSRLNAALAHLAAHSGDPRAAPEIAAQAAEVIALARQAGHRHAEAVAELLLGKLTGDDEGEEHLRRAVALAEQHGFAALAAEAEAALAAARVDEDPEGAARRLAAAADRRHRQEIWRDPFSWYDELTVRWATRPEEQAIEESLRVLDLLERRRDLKTSRRGRAEAFAPWTEVYYWLTGKLLASQGEGAERRRALAFELIERMRARVLAEAVADRRSEEAVPPADEGTEAESAREERRQLIGRLVELQRSLLLAQGLTTAERSGLLAELARVEARLEALEAASPWPQAVTSAAGVQAELAPDEALLSFQTAPWIDVYGGWGGGSWLLVLTADALRVYPLADRSELARAARVAGLIDRLDGSEEQALASLHEDLLAPALADLPAAVGRLLIVPDGPLHLLPFGALREAGEDAPLATRYELELLPSATLWLRWRRGGGADRAAGGTLLALVDPAFLGAADPESEGAQADRSSDPAALADPERSWALGVAGSLGRLPFARREGPRLVRAVASAVVLTADEASERRLKQTDLDGVSILYFAAHAVQSGLEPRRSAVVLAPGSEASEDGLLQPHEIAELDLEGKVVVLASCESAAGRVLAGEGVLSLARPFFEAGAVAVVGSLWRLDDEEASYFFGRFFHHLAGGESVAAALASTQRAWSDLGRPAAAWAGVVVLGDGSVSPLEGGWRRRLKSWRAALALGMVALLCVTGFVLLRRRGPRLSGR